MMTKPSAQALRERIFTRHLSPGIAAEDFGTLTGCGNSPSQIGLVSTAVEFQASVAE